MKLDADVRATLGRLPPKLEQLYLEIYEKLMMSQPKNAGKAAISGVLNWLLCAQRQIKSSELRFAVALNLDISLQGPTKERILDLCHNFVVFDDGLDMFRFAHLSVREFLEKRPEYSQASSHLLAAEICLLKLIAVSKSPAAHSYITNECTMDVCEKLTSMTEKSSRELHDYATLFWKTHCQLAGEEQRTSNVHFEKMLRIFFFENSGVTSPLSTWVRSYRRNRNVRPGNAYILGSSLISSPNSMVRSYLLASACGFCDILRECLARSKLEDFEKDEGISLAALFCQGEAFRLLWSCQDHQNITENTLARAVSTLSEEDIEWLLAQTPKLKITVRVIQGAASREDSRVMKILLDRFEDLEITEEMLTRASWTGYLEAFNMLLTRAEGDVVFDKLLFDAVQGDGSSQIVMMLLDRFGYTHLTTDLLQHAMEHGSDDILQLLLDRSDDAVILKALFHSPDRLSGAASDTTLRQLLDRQSEFPQALLLAAVSKCSASIMPFILKRLGETAKVMLPDMIVRAASNTHDAPGVLDQLLRRAGNVEITEEMLMEAVHNYQFGNEVMKILLDEDREMVMTEEVLEAALRLLDFDETLLLLLERAKAIESSGRFFQAAASNRRCGAELVQWTMDHTKQDPEMTNKLIIWAAANVDNGLEIMLLLENKIGNIKYTDEVLSMVASHGAPQTLEYLLDRLDPTMITGNVIKAATANDIPISTHRKVKLLVARARDLSFDDDLLESAARNLEDINSFKLIWSRRRRKDVTQGLVQPAAENEAFNLEILSFLLHEVHDEDPDIILEENVLKALSGHAFCFHVLEGCLMTAMSKGVEVKVTQDMLTAAVSKRFRYDDGRLLALLLKHSTGAVVADDIFTSAAGSGSDENLRVLSSYCGMDQTPPKYMNIARLRRAIEFWPDFDKNIDVVKELIEQGVNPNIPDESGHTPLFYAARDGLDTIVRQLLEAGADPNHRDEKGRTPLSRIKPFILLGSDKIAEALLSAGADPNSTSNYGWTPLFYAARYGHYELAKTLLAHGVSSRIEDEAGNTPSSVAKDYGKIKMYRLLERHQQS